MNSPSQKADPAAAPAEAAFTPVPSEELMRMRHSCAHVMAAAITRLFRGAKFGVGPAIKDGFYYDVLTEPLLKLEDLPRIEKEMQRIKAEKLPFDRAEVPIERAFEVMAEKKQDFKVDLLTLLRDRGTTAVSESTGDDNAVGLDDKGAGAPVISFYGLGEFTDLCRGPHVEHSGQIGEFSLTHIAGAYWRSGSREPAPQAHFRPC